VMVMSGASGAAAGIAELERLAPALARLG
jgi:hypothetical protein